MRVFSFDTLISPGTNWHSIDLFDSINGTADVGYKLIALDVDGTIRSHDHPTSERTRRTIQSVKDAGAVVTIATGRSYKSGASAASDVNLTAPIVTFQGAHVANPRTGEVLWHVPLTYDMTAAALDALTAWKDVQAAGYLGDEIFVTEMTDWARAYGERTGVGVRVVDSDELTSISLSRIVVHGEDDVIERLERSLKTHFNGDMYITRSLPYFCEILHPNGGKDKALEWLCGHLGVSRDADHRVRQRLQRCSHAGVGADVGRRGRRC